MGKRGCRWEGRQKKPSSMTLARSTSKAGSIRLRIAQDLRCIPGEVTSEVGSKLRLMRLPVRLK